MQLTGNVQMTVYVRTCVNSVLCIYSNTIGAYTYVSLYMCVVMCVCVHVCVCVLVCLFAYGVNTSSDTQWLWYLPQP